MIFSYTEVSAVHHAGVHLSGGARIADPLPVYKALTDHGVGKLVKIKEMGGTVLTGTLAALHTDTFEITPTGAMQPVTLSYTQVSAVHDGVPGRSAAAKTVDGIAVGVVVAAVVVAVVLLGRAGFSGLP